MKLVNTIIAAGLISAASIASADVVPVRVTVDGEYAGLGVTLKAQPVIGYVIGYGNGGERTCYVINDVVYLAYGPGEGNSWGNGAVAAEIDVSPADCSSAAYVNVGDQPW